MPGDPYSGSPSIHTFRERFSLGTSWVFSFHPVLPPDIRPLVPFLGMEVGLGDLKQSPEAGFRVLVG